MPSAKPDSRSRAAFREAPLALALSVIGTLVDLGTLVRFSFFGLPRHQTEAGLLAGTALLVLGAVLYSRHERRRAK